jgi:hypothetical protein
LVVVLPQGYSERHVPELVERHRAWLERTASRLAASRTARESKSSTALPGAVALAAVGQSWSVEYRPTASRRVTATEYPEQRVILSGNTCDCDACRDALLRWLRRKAKTVLEPWLRELALHAEFTFGRVVVRSQRTRWASCSRQGAVSLNVRLLFIAPELVRHVMLHELCHTVRMDHSKRFWGLLEKHDPEWQSHRRQVRAAWHEVPSWLNVGPRV